MAKLLGNSVASADRASRGYHARVANGFCQAASSCRPTVHLLSTSLDTTAPIMAAFILHISSLAKGCRSRREMRVNYFIAMLGELLQRMSLPEARYSIALPDMPQFRRPWARLPALARQRTGISAILVSAQGDVVGGSD